LHHTSQGEKIIYWIWKRKLDLLEKIILELFIVEHSLDAKWRFLYYPQK